MSVSRVTAFPIGNGFGGVSNSRLWVFTASLRLLIFLWLTGSLLGRHLLDVVRKVCFEPSVVKVSLCSISVGNYWFLCSNVLKR